MLHCINFNALGHFFDSNVVECNKGITVAECVGCGSFSLVRECLHVNELAIYNHLFAFTTPFALFRHGIYAGPIC